MQTDIGDYIKKNMKFLSNPIRAKKAGHPPGTLTYTGEVADNKVKLDLITFDSDSCNEFEFDKTDELLAKFDKDKINWINVVGLHDVEVINETGNFFNLHPLVLEDILNTQQQPKIDIEDENIFITLKMLKVNKSGDIDIEHVSFILGSNYVISFQERQQDVFDNIRDRLINNKGKARKRTSDYLFYLLIDAVVDNYYYVLDNINDKIDELEQAIYFNPSHDNFQKIIDYKKHLIHLKKLIYPLESCIRELLDDEVSTINNNYIKYYNDVLDHLKSIIQDLDVLREILIGHVELYMSALNNKMNSVMKTLTIVASIFIPLTFIAGVYGMNFRYMPELESKWGYPLILLIMLITGLGMLFYMKKKKWF
ncbi:magnesium and cobalt transport protein CorA [Bacteroidetes/Chlorobi group bacterium ChocPot_Mid]|jgi:magnesium transporter|nr:MAG: magnesium and cobalt transport protein CorA [Bacteroidetes/Chlorobi group bacterium ChocPot_Mid]